MQNHREWILATLRHAESEAVPYNIMLSPPARQALENHYGGRLENVLDFPIRMTAPIAKKPLYASPAMYGSMIRDDFGVGWSTSAQDRGAPVAPCLAEATLDGYAFPNAAKESRFAEIADWCLRHKHRYRVIWVGDLWERATFMRGMENLCMDLVLHPLFVEQLLRKLTDYILTTMQILCERFDFDCIALSDDYGAQQAMLMSPRDWRKFIKPRLAEIYGLAKKHERAVFHHSCGHIVPVINDMIDLGLDILHPVQPEAMDVVQLKREFGQRLTLCGGVSTQDLLVHGPPERVRREVERLKQKLRSGGGYILEPGITVQADVPMENMIAFIEEARSR